MFIAGADLREFVAGIDAPREQIVGDVHARPATVSAAVEDAVRHGRGDRRHLRRRRRGAGVWCDRRVMSSDSKAMFGFPEVKLGLFPGWGGTVRAPRMVGLANAVELVTSGESIDARAAARDGPGHRCGAAGEAARRRHSTSIRAEQQVGQYLARPRALERADRHQRHRAGLSRRDGVGRTSSRQTKGQYPAPLAALEVMLGAAGVDVDAACQTEAEGWPSCSARRSIAR